MAMKVAVTYANGVFAPDEPVELEEGARALVEVSGGMAALDEAERLFARAFAGGGLDEARASVARMARARGWAYETDADLTSAICRLDGIDKNGRFDGRLRYYSPYCAAEIFRDRAYAAEGDISPPLLDEPWHFVDGLCATRILIRAIVDEDSE